MKKITSNNCSLLYNQVAFTNTEQVGVKMMNATHIIAITSGKGGVGKSTVSVNLALALSRLDKRVGIIDLDIYGFSIPNMLSITERPKVWNEKIIPVQSNGVSVMSTGFMVRDNQPIVWRGPMLGKMIEHFANDVLWGSIDYMILDMPPGTGDVALDMHSMFPKSHEIIVTTPHHTAAHVAERAGTMAQKSNHSILGVIENMAYFSPPSSEEKYYLFGKGGGQTLADSLQVPLLDSLPIAIPNQEGKMETIVEESDPLYQHFHHIAFQIEKQVEGINIESETNLL
ncbi:Mrp/NBP35 family ATP-binding protein [Alkalihalobacterium bogoriense]|uniref:Mrp/NBP35 family ATP-binding protein n=1 Tax=Alkalihalobacterium bogoriense TaxID=246272 RepID=UPI002480F4D8|nr:Mrp/NBP35 family ATP-binding protein [Alkalihalobacterium bogoriense]